MPSLPRSAAIVGGALLASGCYTYRDISPSTILPPDAMVRVELSDLGAVNVTPAIGPAVLFVEGAIDRSGNGGLSLRVATLRRRGEAETRWTGDLVTLQPSDIRALEERRLSRRRTIVGSSTLGAAAVGIVVWIAKATGTASGGSGERPIPTP